MPYVADGEALDRPFLDLDALAADLGPPPWRACLVGTPGLRVLLLHWPAGYATVPHEHPAAEEIFRVIRGRAFFTIGDEPEREVGPGDFMFALRGVRHAIRVPDDGPLLLLASVAPNEDRPDETIEPA
jgi:quercetin dioxygenase-like cupin family protein